MPFMKNALIAISFIILTLNIHGQVHIHDNIDSVKNEIKNLCGVNSVFIVTHLLNIKQKYIDVYDDLINNKYAKVSVIDIEKTLKKYNVKTTTLKLRPSQLYNYNNGLFIMYTPPAKGFDIGHFSVLRVIDKNKVQIIDPPYTPRILKKSNWINDDKIIFIAIGDNFKPFSKITPLDITSITLIFAGIALIAHGKYSKHKANC